MATNRTFTMIKPDAVANGHIGNILAMITNAGFKIISLKLTQLTVADAQAFYSVHAAKRRCLEKTIEDFRTFMLQDAAELNSICYLY
jgi:nucleoside diphosphate kinase